MEIEKLGDDFINGGMINLDNSSCEIYENELKKISLKKEEIINKINSLLKQI